MKEGGETFILSILRRPWSFIVLPTAVYFARVNSCPKQNELAKQKRVLAIKCRTRAPFRVDTRFVWGVRATRIVCR